MLPSKWLAIRPLLVVFLAQLFLPGAIGSALGQIPIDLTTWTAESYPAVSGFDPGDWEIAPDGESVLQSVNGQPTLFFSDFQIGSMEAEGVIDVSGGDDDYIGFAIGYQPGDIANPDADYLLLDWKGGNQPFNFGAPSCTPSSTALSGLAISRVRGIPTADEFWGHLDFDSACSPLGHGLEELQRAATLGSSAWSGSTEYRFRIVFTGDRVQVFVDGALEIDVMGSFADGRVAFYNFSQADVRYSGFISSPAGMFRRGDVNNDTLVTGDDETALLDWLFAGGRGPVDCPGQPLPEPADTNDNEWVTIADYLQLRNVNLGLSTLPAPVDDCELDPTSSTAGFDQVDPGSRVTIGEVEVVGPASDHDVLLSVFVDVATPVTGLTLILEYDPTLMTPFATSPFDVATGVVAARSVGDKLILGWWSESDGDLLLPASSGTWQFVGTVGFELAPGAVFPPLTWAPQVSVDGILYRATIVDDSFADHHPEQVVGLSRFARGDANNDAVVDLADSVYTLGWLFQGLPDPECEDAADANNDGMIDVSDPVYALAYLFSGGCILPAPYPQCGLDGGGPGCGGSDAPDMIDELSCDGVVAGCP